MKWKKLEHNGILFPPDFETKNIKIKIKGEKVDLDITREEMVYQWAKKKDTTYVQYKIFQKNSLFTERGLIENDDIVVNPKLIEVLKKKFSDKIAVVTGRGYNAINSSLKEILTQFNVKHSVFLEDEPRNLAKPNPESLIRSIKGLNSKNCLYVGDSMEDLIMAQRASELGFQTTFCGIYGSGKLPEVKKKFFVERDVPFILESINFIPKALNLV